MRDFSSYQNSQSFEKFKRKKKAPKSFKESGLRRHKTREHYRPKKEETYA